MTDPRPVPHGTPPLVRRVDPLAEPEASLREDEALLRAGRGVVRVAVFDRRAVSFGVGVSPRSGYLERARAEGIPVVRRSTGGTGVLHDRGDLAWSVVLPRAHPAVGRDFVRAYERLGHGVVRFLEELGQPASWAPPLGLAPDYCFLSARGQVLMVRGRVLGGAAQHLARTALLHQGVVPLELDRATLDRLFDLHGTGASERLTSLRELGIDRGSEALAPALADALAAALDAP